MDATLAAPATGQEIPEDFVRDLSREERLTIRRCLTVLGVLVTLGMAGGAFSLYLVNHAPLLLVALSPIGRHLVLVAPTVDPVAFTFVGTTRRMLFYTASFFLGRALGPKGFAWLEMRAARFARWIRWLEGVFNRAPSVVVFCLPGPAVSSIAGSAGMAPRRFLLLASAGLVVRMILIVLFGEWMREPIEAILAWIDRYWIPGTVLMVAGVLAYRYRRKRGVVVEPA
jgi:membrane protein DedA with SNARE-associated domain